MENGVWIVFISTKKHPVITGLVEVLKDPQASKRMVDAIVTENKETGKTSLNIPVKDRESVMQFVSLLGKLLNP